MRVMNISFILSSEHGGWSSWEEWSVCPVKCGEGQRTRSRECNRPRPLFGGDPCAGSEIESDVCDVGTPCPSKYPRYNA